MGPGHAVLPCSRSHEGSVRVGRPGNIAVVATLGAAHLAGRRLGQPSGGGGIEEALWQRCADDSPWNCKDTKHNSGRFMGFVSRSLKEAPFQRLCAYTFLALEMGWMTGAAFERLVLPRDPNDGPVEDSAKMSRPQADEALLRASCRNAVVLAVHFLENSENQCNQAILTSVAKVWLPWHSKQNKQLRCCAEAPAWLREELAGNFARAICHTWQRLGADLCAAISQGPL